LLLSLRERLGEGIEREQASLEPINNERF